MGQPVELLEILVSSSYTLLLVVVNVYHTQRVVRHVCAGRGGLQGLGDDVLASRHIRTNTEVFHPRQLAFQSTCYVGWAKEPSCGWEEDKRSRPVVDLLPSTE